MQQLQRKQDMKNLGNGEQGLVNLEKNYLQCPTCLLFLYPGNSKNIKPTNQEAFVKTGIGGTYHKDTRRSRCEKPESRARRSEEKTA